MAPGPRVSKAFIAMKALGIPPETVKPVLKYLLRLYDKNWELIEEDNYRTLADFIFELDDEKLKERKKRHAPIDDALESPFKRQHLGPQEDQTSSTMDNASNGGLEEGEISQPSGVVKLNESSQSYLGASGVEPSSHSRQAPPKNNRKDPSSSQLITGDRNIFPEKGSRASCSNQALNVSGSSNTHLEKIPEHSEDNELLKPKAKQSIVDSRDFNVPPSSRVRSASMEGYFTANNSTRCLMPQSLDEDRKDNDSPCDYGTSCRNTLDIVSSPCGEVKFSLNCSQALGQHSFHNPCFDKVLKCVEDKYLRSYKTQVSVMKLLKDLCESYLALATNDNDRSLANLSSESNPQCIKVSKIESSRAAELESDLTKKIPSSSVSSSSLNLVAAQKQTKATDKRKSFLKIIDITKGTEKVKISLLDEVGNEHLPNFVYVSQNIIYQNAYIHVSLARIVDEDCCSSCIGDCLSSSVPCACACDTGGEFAYSPQGLLTEEFLESCISKNREPQKHYHFYCQDCPLERAKNIDKPEKCKGHLLRKFIKECWIKCGCDMQCGNRVVQRGITCKLQVFLTDAGKGWGLHTLEELCKGAFVCEYVGEVLTNMELYDRNKTHNSDRHTYPVLLDADWGSEGVLKDEDALCLDATFYGNVARFINHRCFDANLIAIPVEVETPDHHYYHLAFFTKRKVEALEELTWDYGIDFDDHNHPIKAFKCTCGSVLCRDKKGKGAKTNMRIR